MRLLLPGIVIALFLTAPAMAAGFDGEWSGQVPAVAGCAGGGESTVSLAVKDGQVQGTLHNARGNVAVSGTVDAGGAGAVRIAAQAPGAVKFDGNHFTLDWQGAAGCARHAEGGRAPASVPSQPHVALTSEACGFHLSAQIFGRYAELSQKGVLACPVADEKQAPVSPKGTQARWVQFLNPKPADSGRYLIAMETGPNAGRVLAVTGCFFLLYSGAGGPAGAMGLPLTDAPELPGGSGDDQQVFEGGTVKWYPAEEVCRFASR